MNISALSENLQILLPSLSRSLMPSVATLPGGLSNRTYLVTWGDKRFVVRAPPVGADILTHDVRRECRALRILAPHLAWAPKVFGFVRQTEALETPFFVMEWRSGVSFERIKTNARRRAAFALVDALARIHRLDATTTSIRELGHPDRFFERQVEGWKARYQALERSDAGNIRLFEHLKRCAPRYEGPACALHNDFKFDNVLFCAEDDPSIAAVLDWEMCSFGDPLVDLGLFLAYWPDAEDPPERAQGRLFVPDESLPTRQELVRRYAQQHPIPLEHLDLYVALGFLKIGVMLRQIAAREGTDAPLEKCRAAFRTAEHLLA